MKQQQIYLSTIDGNAADLARRHGFGLEIAEYCTLTTWMIFLK